MGTQSERPPGSGIRPQEASEIRPQGSRVSQASGRPGAGTSPEARGLRPEAFGLKTAFLSLLAIALLAWFLRAADMTVVMGGEGPGADTVMYGEPPGGRVRSAFLRDPEGNYVQLDQRA